MQRLPQCLLLALVLCASVAWTQTCDSANTNQTTSYNSDCPNGRPYCLGTCYQCSATAVGNFYCDCPSGQGCQRDYTQSTYSKCGVYPKYGASCTQNSDCTTTYSPVYLSINLPCVNGKCRYCDPVADANVTHVCDQRQSQYPATKICVSPGVWGVAGQSSSTTVAATTSAAASTGAASSTSASDR